ncbi:MAG: sugar transferase [Alphaproteobacteria bacterium]|nr:sugar transferase [Alphaproteobacteria bacterium]
MSHADVAIATLVAPRRLGRRRARNFDVRRLAEGHREIPVKRVLDVIAALLILVAIAPLGVAIVVALWREGGPLFYGHPRIGRGGRGFRCWKFRTMVPDADRRLAELLARDEAARAEWARDFKLRDDPRVTALGRWLRATSLDELPQLYNVLRGEMSLVGPRPIVGAELSRYGDHAAAYLRCTPGLTGLWQVSGRNDVSYQDRVQLDRRYAERRSLWLDLAILARTPGAVLRRAGAY